MPPTPRRRTVTTDDGVVLPVVEAGDPDGPPVVLLHGVASSSAEWAGVMADPRLADRRLVALDLRGHGEGHQHLTGAQEPASDLAATHATWAKDLDAVLAGLERPHLVGTSFGATVVQDWMVDHGGLAAVAGVTMVAAIPAIVPTGPDDPVGRLMAPESAAALGGAAAGGEQDYAVRVLARGAGDVSADPAVVAAVAATAAATQPEAVVGALVAPFDHRGFWAALPDDQRARATALVCRDDQVFDAAALEECWAQAGVAVRVVPDACHALPLREPGRTATLLLEALGAG